MTLWWMAGFRLLSGLLIFPALYFGVGGPTGFPSGAQFLLNALTFVVPAAIGAVFLKVFAPSLAASMTGSGALQSDAIASRHDLEPHERDLARAGAGLFLLFLGAITAIPSILAGVYTIFFEGASTGLPGSTAMIYSMASAALLAILQCAVGFVLAFQSGLRRLIKPERNL